MLEAAVIVARLLQYLGAAILFGSSLFFVYAPPAVERGWARPLVAGAAVVLAAAALAGIAAQASLFAGSWSAGLTGEAMGAVVSSMDLGKAAVVRGGAAMASILLLAFLPGGRARWMGAAAAGGVAAASLAWMGHAAAGEGRWANAHLVADVIHALAAAAWIGALCVLAPLALARDDGRERREALRRALLRFSAIGPAIVAAVLLSGLVNGWVLVGPDHLTDLPRTPYGQLLLAKLALFAGMLALAAANRWRFTATAIDPARSLLPVKRSISLETAAGLAVLAVVAWLGTLPPPGA